MDRRLPGQPLPVHRRRHQRDPTQRHRRAPARPPQGPLIPDSRPTIAFDLDGTLSDWETAIRAVEPEHADALLAVLDGLHPRVDGDVVDGVHYLLFVDGPQIWREVLEAVDSATKPAELTPAGSATERADRFMARFRPVAYPEVEAVLAELHDRYRLALVTNSPRAADDVEALGFGRFFDQAVAIPPELRKPRPEGFWHACEELGVEPADLVYVGDSYRCDIEGGLAAGVRPVWVDRWDTKLPVPDGVTRVTSLTALPAVLP